MTVNTVSRRASPTQPAASPRNVDWAGLAAHFTDVRDMTMRLVEPLQAEDMVVQSMPEASPTKWHLAHTTWFFETFVLRHAVPGAADAHPDFDYLFNSYYNAVGPQFPRLKRGLVTRPTVRDVFAYRKSIDERVTALLASADDVALSQWAPVIELGIHHEQQHQELVLTDIKHLLAQNPLHPIYFTPPATSLRAVPSGRQDPTWHAYTGGLEEIGHDGTGFSYDNEGPRHAALLAPFELSARLVTCGDWIAFMDGGGYEQPRHWLADGWATAQREGWRAPLYWDDSDGGWAVFTLAGMREVVRNEPVSHVSFYEADAFARWSGARLPTEFEWEVAAGTVAMAGSFLECGTLQPRPATGADSPAQMYGDVWQWTASPYVGYPGYRAAEGAIGEYNGKFMSNQVVLRGGSVATPASHMRASYRNFFYPHCRWQFMGLRLARDPC